MCRRCSAGSQKNRGRSRAFSSWGGCAFAAFVATLLPRLAVGEGGELGASVTREPQKSPAANVGGAVAYDSQRSEILLWGGIDPADRDAAPVLRAFDPGKKTWRIIETHGRQPRGVGKPAMVYDEKRDALYVFGGWPVGEESPVNELWQLRVGDAKPAWSLVECAGETPPARNGLAMALDRKEDRLLVHGGDGGAHPEYGFSPLDDLWEFDLAKGQWRVRRANGDIPAPRWNHGAALDEESQRLYVFGGAGHVRGAPAVDNDVHILDFRKLEWSVARGSAARPGFTQGATLTFDASRRALVLIGGLSLADSGPAGSDSVWLFDPPAQRWTEIKNALPAPRMEHGAAYDPRSRAHVVLGGTTPKERGNYYERGSPIRDVLVVKIVEK